MMAPSQAELCCKSFWLFTFHYFSFVPVHLKSQLIRRNRESWSNRIGDGATKSSCTDSSLSQTVPPKTTPSALGISPFDPFTLTKPVGLLCQNTLTIQINENKINKKRKEKKIVVEPICGGINIRHCSFSCMEIEFFVLLTIAVGLQLLWLTDAIFV